MTDANGMEPTSNARCVKKDGEWWCPRHQGEPRITLDSYPPFCGECYDKILDANGERGKIVKFNADGSRTIVGEFK